MSIDPSPWAELDGHEEDSWNVEPTEELLKLAEEERNEQEQERARNARLWQMYAARLTLKGGLTR